jgi:hypothetical protein
MDQHQTSHDQQATHRPNVRVEHLQQELASLQSMHTAIANVNLLLLAISMSLHFTWTTHAQTTLLVMVA